MVVDREGEKGGCERRESVIILGCTRPIVTINSQPSSQPPTPSLDSSATPGATTSSCKAGSKYTHMSALVVSHTALRERGCRWR